MIAAGLRATMSATGVSEGTISEYTWASRTRRAMSWAYCAPKSTTRTVAGCTITRYLPVPLALVTGCRDAQTQADQHGAGHRFQPAADFSQPPGGPPASRMPSSGPRLPSVIGIARSVTAWVWESLFHATHSAPPK